MSSNTVKTLAELYKATLDVVRYTKENYPYNYIRVLSEAKHAVCENFDLDVEEEE